MSRSEPCSSFVATRPAPAEDQRWSQWHLYEGEADDYRTKRYGRLLESPMLPALHPLARLWQSLRSLIISYLVTADASSPPTRLVTVIEDVLSGEPRPSSGPRGVLKNNLERRQTLSSFMRLTSVHMIVMDCARAGVTSTLGFHDRSHHELLQLIFLDKRSMLGMSVDGGVTARVLLGEIKLAVHELGHLAATHSVHRTTPPDSFATFLHPTHVGHWSEVMTFGAKITWEIPVGEGELVLVARQGSSDAATAILDEALAESLLFQPGPVLAPSLVPEVTVTLHGLGLDPNGPLAALLAPASSRHASHPSFCASRPRSLPQPSPFSTPPRPRSYVQAHESTEQPARRSKRQRGNGAAEGEVSTSRTTSASGGVSGPSERLRFKAAKTTDKPKPSERNRRPRRSSELWLVEGDDDRNVAEDIAARTSTAWIARPQPYAAILGHECDGSQQPIFL